MCQAYEGERLFMAAMDDYVAEKGWAAHRDGKPREYDNILHDDAFFHGWDCRAAYKKQGDPIPHSIVNTWRERRERETGKRPYHEEPTLAQADEIA